MSDAPTLVTRSVCVIIAAYNAQGTIARAVASALAQPEVAEVLVVDDASKDATVAATLAADDNSGRLKVLTQTVNAGPSAARNRAIRESVSPWLAILDADDFFLPGRIGQLLSYSDNADMIADNMWQVAENALDGPKKSLLKSMAEPYFITFSQFVLSNVTKAGTQRAELGFIKPIIRRAFLDAHDIRYNEKMRLGEDFELYACSLAQEARLVMTPVQGYVSVVRANSLSGQHSESDLLILRDGDNKILNELHLPTKDRRALRKHYLSIDCRYQWRMLIIAVKNRDLGAALASFLRPYPVPLYLFKQLAVQAYLRSFSFMSKKPS